MRKTDKDILRIIDVNLNRSREGLRVCEEAARFILNDKILTKRLKAIRHNILDIVKASNLDLGLLCKSRNIKDDVGKEPSFLERKKGWQSVFFANIQRAKEALRVLEEFFGLLDSCAGDKFKALRFDVYELEKKIVKRSKALSDNGSYPLPKDLD